MHGKLIILLSLPRFPFAALFEREPQYGTAEAFPTMTFAFPTGLVPSGILTGSGSIGTFPTVTGTAIGSIGTGSPLYPNITSISSTNALPGPTDGPVSESISSFSIPSTIGPIKALLTGITSLPASSIPPAPTGTCPVVTPVTVTETVTQTVIQSVGAPYPSGTGGGTGTVGSLVVPKASPFYL